MIKLLQSFGSSKIQIFKYLIFPYNYKTIISSLKINISMSLVGVIMGEMLVSKEGLGYLIVYGSQIFNLNLVMSSIIILSLISSLLYYILLFIEKKIIKNI
jgi:NitT/TauT family transport system permease protein